MLTQSERLLLRLCSDLGQEHVRPLRPGEYRLLRERLLAAAQPEAELDRLLLERLGYDRSGAERILSLLERDPAPWLGQLEQMGIRPLTRLNHAYPRRLREKLGEDAPLLLFACGERALLERTAVSVVGARAMGETGRVTAEAAGRWIAEQGYVLCTGGAAGVDTVALETCLRAGGSAILYLPGEMRPVLQRYPVPLRHRQLVLLSGAPTAHFHPFWAMARNRWIHIQGSAVIVCQCQKGHGGSWRGAVENLGNQWSPVFVPSGDGEGLWDLRARGAKLLDWNALQNVLS